TDLTEARNEPPGSESPRRRHRRGDHADRRRHWPHRTLIAAGLVLLLAAGIWQLVAALWTANSERGGKNLLARERQIVTQVGRATAGGHTGSGCTPGNANDPQGVIQIPKIGLVAPVLQGTDNAQLDVAVGHDSYSVWPGATGNAVLEAHDVSYFVNIAQLVRGDQIQYVTPCTTYVFTVQGHQVVKEGSPVYDTTTPTMTLVTCWPTNALWFTPDRYLVTATMVASMPTGSATTAISQVPAWANPPTVPVPSALAAEGVTLATYSVPMGGLSLGGAPNPNWAQSPGPLAVENSAVEAYIAGVRSLTENRLDWWKAITAPGTAFPNLLYGAHIASYVSSLNVAIEAADTVPAGVILSTTVSVTGGSAPGRYAMIVNETIKNGQLLITGWTMARH
ncbi:MAG TPA: sortase, partial [Mycobacterium sp.]|uniref:sortase domain-containing protein n=1 Tax=Mycobacterium sp. TaxID=1785 RepID=UPI002D69CB22